MNTMKRSRRDPRIKTRRTATVLSQLIGLCALGFTFFQTMASQANGDGYWPPANTVLDPQNPTSSDVVAITLSGMWPSICEPNGSDVSIAGNEIYFDVMWHYPPGIVCAAIILPWARTEYVGPLSPGTYTVYARLLGDPEVPETYTLMTEFIVVEACNDNDGDGYGNPASATCPHPELDCDDTNPKVNPGVVEDCRNGIDDNCDGLIDDADPACQAPEWSAGDSAQASMYGSGEPTGSYIVNHLAIFLPPIGTVLTLRILHRKKK